MKKTISAVIIALGASSGAARAAPDAQSPSAASVTAITKSGGTLVDSRIDAVTAFRGRALVVRRAEHGVSRGSAGEVVRLSVAGLPATMDEASIQARCHGPARPTVVGVTLDSVVNDQMIDEGAKKAENEIQEMQDKRRVISDRLGGIEERRQFLRSLRQTYLKRVGEDDGQIDFKQWLEAQRMLAKGLEDLAGEQRQTELERRALDGQISTAQQRMSDLSSKRGNTSRVAQIDLKPRRAGGVVCEVRYLVPGVSWSSAYDARLEDGALKFVQYGVVHNRSGEDWNDVKVSVSTANPVESVVIPQVLPTFLRIYQPYRHGWRPAASPPAMGAMAKVAEESDARRSLRDGDGAEDRRERQEIAQLTRRELHVVYTAKSRTTVASSGAPRKIALAEHGFEPELTYLAAPRVSDGAYLTAKVKNGTRAPMLAGEVRLFMGDDFIGKTRIGNVVPSDELVLSFGKDDRVKVERERIVREQKQVGVFTKEIEVREAYRLRVHNLVGRPIKLALLDAVPVSTDKRITVELDESSTARSKADEKDRPGTLRWNLDLSSDAKQELNFGFKVRYPVGTRVAGL